MSFNIFTLKIKKICDVLITGGQSVWCFAGQQSSCTSDIFQERQTGLKAVTVKFDHLHSRGQAIKEEQGVCLWHKSGNLRGGER